MRLRIVLVFWSYRDDNYFTTEPIQRSAEDHAMLQIRNMLDLGYRQSEIIFATNFDWEYMGIKTVPLNRSAVPEGVKLTATKIFAVRELIEENIITQEDVFWLHDLDVVQNIAFAPPKEMENYNLGLVPFSSELDMMGCYSMFIRANAYHIFDAWCKEIEERKLCDEKTLNYRMIATGKIKEGVDFVRLNRTYGYTYKSHCQFWKKQKSHNIVDATLGAISQSLDYPTRAVDFNYMPYRHHSKSWKRKTKSGELSERLMKVLYEPLDKWP